jgi:hypothetical protein
LSSPQTSAEITKCAQKTPIYLRVYDDAAATLTFFAKKSQATNTTKRYCSFDQLMPEQATPQWRRRPRRRLRIVIAAAMG